jgi:hypothetical protein
MKAKVLALSLLAFLCAQLLVGLEWSIGARAGASANFLGGTYGDQLEESLRAEGAGEVARQAFFSYCAGASLRMQLWKFLSLQADLGFGPAGGGLLASDGLDVLTGIWGNQLDFSILALAGLRLGRVHLNLLVGPGVQLCLGSPVLVRNDGFIRSESAVADTADLLPALLVVGGVGASLPLGPGLLLFDARWNWGLSSVLSASLPDDPTLRFSGVRVSSGYELPLRRKKGVKK